jgi:hypothetical protein
MRLVTLACAILAVGGTAYAQDTSAGRSVTQPPVNSAGRPTTQPPVNPPSGSTTRDPVGAATATPPGNLPPAPSVNPAPTGQPTPSSAKVPDMPSSWKGDAASWESHVTACKGRYPTYDANTDKYDGPNGAKTACALAMPAK